MADGRGSYNGSVINPPIVPGTGTAPAAGTFTATPSPQQGQGTFGLVPGPVGVPNVFGDLSSVYPNLSGTNAAVSGAIASKLAGNISPQTMNALQDAAARFGVSSGMPGSGLQQNQLFGNIAGFTENQIQQGIQDYNSTLPTVSSTQTVNPALQAQIAETNSVNAAAPNPADAQTYAKSLFDDYLNKLKSSGSQTNTPWWAQGSLTAPGWGPGALTQTVHTPYFG